MGSKVKQNIKQNRLVLNSVKQYNPFSRFKFCFETQSSCQNQAAFTDAETNTLLAKFYVNFNHRRCESEGLEIHVRWILNKLGGRNIFIINIFALILGFLSGEVWCWCHYRPGCEMWIKYLHRKAWVYGSVRRGRSGLDISRADFTATTTYSTMYGPYWIFYENSKRFQSCGKCIKATESSRLK